MVISKVMANRKYKSEINFILLFLLIFISSDTLMFGTNGNILFISIRYVFDIAVLLMLFLQLFLYKYKLVANNCIPCLLAIMMLLISALVNADLKGGYIYKIILILLAVLFTSKVRIDEFEIHYDNIMFIISIASLIGFFILVVAPLILKVLPITYNTNHVGYYNAIITVLKSSNDNIISRNYGIFREPGIYQFFLIIALLFQFFSNRKISNVRCLLYISSLLTTFSTTAYLALAGVLLAFF
jgi:hypothetical protein